MKRTLALFVGIVLLAAMIAGCTTTQPTAAPTTAAAATTEATQAPTVAPTEEATPAPAAAEPAEIVMERPLWGNGNPDSDYAKRIQEAILKAINIKVTIVGDPNPSDQWQRPNLMLASGEQLDIFQVPPDMVKGWRKYKNDGVIIPLNDLLESNGQDLKKATDPNTWQMVTDADGKIWALCDEQPGMTSCIFIRQDWLDQASLQIPKTWEEFENVLTTFKQKFNDQGFVPLWPNAEETVFLGAFVEHVADYKDANGQMQPYWSQPGYKDYLTKMADWYKKGLLNKEISTMNYDSASQLMWGGQVGLMLNWMSLYGLTANLVNIQANVPDAQVSPLAPPSGPLPAKIGGGSTESADVMITASSKNAAACMTFINWSMATDEGWALCKFGVKDTDYSVTDTSDPKHTIIKQISTDYAIYCSTRLNSMQGKLLISSSAVSSNDFYQNPQTYPVQYPDLLTFVPDQTKLQPLKDKLQQLDLQLDETRQKIIMGELPVSKWDDMVKAYMDGGGTAYYAEITSQFVK